MSREVLGPPGDGVAPAWGREDDALGGSTPRGVDLGAGASASTEAPVLVADLDAVGTADTTGAADTTDRAETAGPQPGPRPHRRDRARRPGEAATAAERLPAARRGDPSDASDLSDLSDLSDPSDPSEPRRPEATATPPAAVRDHTAPGVAVPTWSSGALAGAPAWVRGPLGIVAGVAAGLVVGALVAGMVAERSLERAASEQVSLLAELAPPLREDIGTGVLHTSLDVVNAGPAAVTVVGAALTPGSDVIDVVAERRVEAGQRIVVPVVVTPACDGPTAERLALIIRTTTGETTRVNARSLGGRDYQPRQLRDLCSAAAQPLDVWRVLARRDGTLTVQLINTSGEDHEVDLALPSGSSAESIPPLPTSVPAGRSAFLQIRMSVDECTLAVQAADAGSNVRLTVDGRRGPSFEAAATAVAGWFAREVALACPPA